MTVITATKGRLIGENNDLQERSSKNLYGAQTSKKPGSDITRNLEVEVTQK